MEPRYPYLMNVASVLYIMCYIPELYANYKNKNANIYNLPEKVVMLVATVLAFTYAVLNEDQALLINYGPILGLDVIAFGMRGFYVWKTARVNAPRQLQEPSQEASPDTSTLP
jgi:uncharacterized protein with PQ loop repeat